MQEHTCRYSCLFADDGVQHMRERGVVLHAFDAEVSDELSVYQGEEVGNAVMSNLK